MASNSVSTESRSGEQSSVRVRRRRGRIAKACSQCHARKQKCDGSHPCQNCVLRGVSQLCALRVQASASSPQNPSVGITPERPASAAGPSTHAQQAETADQNPTLSDRGVPQIGQLWKSRGAPAFFGSSYLGPQAAAAMIDSPAPYVQPGANTSRRSMNAKPFRDEAGPFAQLWDLLGLLPRQKTTVDRLVDHFLTRINPRIDAVHSQSFQKEYDRFWGRKSGFDDVTTVDIRWLALLFAMLAFGSYLDCPTDAVPEIQREYEESSLRFFWACRKAIVIAPSFYGESTDLVRAGILVTRYCLFSQRITESWLTIGFAARLAMAQGFHIDGTNWALPRRVTESRRRLWCHLYLLDRMIALALGRPYCIIDAQSLAKEPENVLLDDLTDPEAVSAKALDVTTDPTPAVLAIFSLNLAKVIGQIQEQNVGIRAISYREVLRLDTKLLSWKSSLPAYLAFESPDLSLDETHPFLKWTRSYLHTAFHFARITLHRPYIWRSSVTDQHRFSREVSFASACADLKIRLDHDDSCGEADHYSWCLSTPQLFNSAIVVGIIALQEQSWGAKDLNPVINDLQSYCDRQNQEMWINEFGLAEVKVVEMVIAKLRQQSVTRQPNAERVSLIATAGSAINNASTEQNAQQHDDNESLQSLAPPPDQPAFLTSDTAAQANLELLHQQNAMSSWDVDPLWMPGPPNGSSNILQNQQFGGAFSFPGPMDLATWQDVIDAIGTHTNGEAPFENQ